MDTDQIAPRPSSDRRFLRAFAKLVVLATVILIFIGGLVTSHGAGLAVPDWPTTYGQNMFTYPVSEWQGGILYEHGHRLFASLVGFLIIILAVWLPLADKRRWLRNLGFLALVLVIAQGVLGGVSVLMRLSWGTPMPVWFLTLVFHGVMAQSFLILTIFLAYAVSKERRRREEAKEAFNAGPLATTAIVCLALIYLQLIVGASMRHLGAGMAIPDFPSMGGYLIPPFNAEMLERVNAMRQAYSNTSGVAYQAATMPQVVIHFAHRLVALFVTGSVVVLLFQAVRTHSGNRPVMNAVYLLVGLVVVQFCLGVATVLTFKQPLVTSLHVVVGAMTLGAAALLVFRILPLGLRAPRKTLADSGLQTVSPSFN